MADPGGQAPSAAPRRQRWPLIVALVLLLPIALVSLAAGTLWHRYTEAGPLAAPHDVVIPRGGIGAAADALIREGVIAEPLLLRAFSWATHSEGEARAGEFTFPAHASLRDVLHVLRTARPVLHRLTIPEGLTARQILNLLERGDILTGDPPEIAEGSLLPQTYAFERGTQRASVAARAKAAMDKALAEAWTARVPNLPLANAQEALVLASIVERETARPEERPRVAAVYLNRLRLGMMLQADPTVVYAVSDGLGVLDHPLTRAELDRDSPFNTYKVKGLPPTPIAAPGTAAILAVLHPLTTDELYFVADGTGGHVFARTAEDHNRNVARWRALGTPVAR